MRSLSDIYRGCNGLPGVEKLKPLWASKKIVIGGPLANDMSLHPLAHVNLPGASGEVTLDHPQPGMFVYLLANECLDSLS